MRNIFSSPYTWASILITLQILSLVFMPDLNTKIVVTAFIGLGSMFIMGLKKNSTASFFTAVGSVFFIAALFMAYLRLCKWFPSLMEAGGMSP